MRWLTIDIGETTGWAVWEGVELVDSGQDPLWEFIDLLDAALRADRTAYDTETNPFCNVAGIIIEDFVLYPDKARALAWDKLRTVRGLGAVTLLARQHNLPYEEQGAYTKDAADAAGAAELFTRPLHENRHANDAIRHGVYWMAMNEGNPFV